MTEQWKHTGDVEVGVAYPTRHLMTTEGINGPPDKPGWYLARMNYRADDEGREVVKVTHLDSRTLQVWQPGDTRPWRLEEFEWFARIYP